MEYEDLLNFKPYRNLTCWTFFKEENLEYVKMFTPRGIIKLNKIGSLIWKLLDENATINDIIKRLTFLFPDTELELIKNDVINFLTKLERDEIIILNGIHFNHIL